ncbi:hypothetical protein ACIQNG_36225 [Streptomyces sp. NPDC091377]|uniref:hypothetical protein n=1 Tax=unclassified Streptomyces TaxID=2593676 RepID=UPI00381802FA
MRPRRFAAFALDVLKNTPGVTQVQALEDANTPNGIAVTANGTETRWGIVGQLAEGERHEHEEQPVQGAPAAWTEPTPGDSAEGWLAAAIGRAESPEIARIERWSTREGARPDFQGITVFFHNTARAFVRKL